MPTPELAFVLFTAAAILAVAGQLLVLRAAMDGRTPSSVRSLAGRVRELVWIALPALALLLVLLATYRELPRRNSSELRSPATPSQPAVGSAART